MAHGPTFSVSVLVLLVVLHLVNFGIFFSPASLIHNCTDRFLPACFYGLFFVVTKLEEKERIRNYHESKHLQMETKTISTSR